VGAFYDDRPRVDLCCSGGVRGNGNSRGNEIHMGMGMGTDFELLMGMRVMA